MNKNWFHTDYDAYTSELSGFIFNVSIFWINDKGASLNCVVRPDCIVPKSKNIKLAYRHFISPSFVVPKMRANNPRIQSAEATKEE